MRLTIKARIRWHYIWRGIKMLFAKDKRGVYPIGFTNLSMSAVELKLIQYGYSFNYWSFQYRDCVVDVRKLYISGHNEVRQIHVRVFNDGMITAHDEFAYEWDALAHIDAVGLRRIKEAEYGVLAMVLLLKKYPKVLVLKPGLPQKFRKMV